MEVPQIEPRLLVVTSVPALELPRLAPLPVILSRVSAGFPSPADDNLEPPIDLHDLTGATAESCYFVRVSGESMTGAGIQDGNVLVVDRAAEPTTGCVVVASLDGDLTVKRFVKDKRGAQLLAEHLGYSAIELRDGQDLVIWGVVTFSLHDHCIRRKHWTAKGA